FNPAPKTSTDLSFEVATTGMFFCNPNSLATSVHNNPSFSAVFFKLNNMYRFNPFCFITLESSDQYHVVLSKGLFIELLPAESSFSPVKRKPIYPEVVVTYFTSSSLC